MKFVDTQKYSNGITFIMATIYEYFGSKVMEKVTIIRQHCEHCLRGHNLMRTLLVIFCIMIVVKQIAVNIQKMIDIPITTYTHFDFNKTIAYPSITFCREPAYKFEKLMQYGLLGHPRFVSTWSKFNFFRTTLDKLWDEITYNDEEYFVTYALNELSENLNLTPTLGLVFGRCYTLTPNVLVNRATKASGYSVTLHHTNSGPTSPSPFPPGYHVHVHYEREPYTEVEAYNGGLVDYLYVNSGETLNVKLTVDQYIKISHEDDPCTDASNYSANKCTTKFVWDKVTTKTGCSGPWMETDLPYCNNYSDMAKLISNYVSTYKDHEYCGCPRFCRSYFYNAFVTDRQTMLQWDSLERQWFVTNMNTSHFTQVYMHFNSMMVSVYEERYNYDWNTFLSDLGGSIGFLLGLSVFGLMSILTNIWYMIKSSIASKRLEEDSSSVCTDLATISKHDDLKNFSWNNNYF